MEEEYISKFLDLFSLVMVFIVFLVAYYFYLKFAKYRAEVKLQIGLLQKQLDDTKNSVSPQDLSELKGRVEVLEKVVTEPGYDLNSKISNLE